MKTMTSTAFGAPCVEYLIEGVEDEVAELLGASVRRGVAGGRGGARRRRQLHSVVLGEGIEGEGESRE